MEKRSSERLTGKYFKALGRLLRRFFRAFGRLCRNFFDITFLKYIIIGLSTTVVGTGLMYLLFNAFHFSYWVSSASNHIVTSVITFFLNRRIAFQSKERSFRQVLLYILNIAVDYFVAYGTARPFTQHVFAGMTATGQDNLAMFIGLLVYKIFNYFGQRFIVFREKDA